MIIPFIKLKLLVKIWPLIILMMIAPSRRAIGAPESIDQLNKELKAFESSKLSIGSGAFVLRENTVLKLDRSVNITISGNLYLHSPITGEGRLILQGKQRMLIDANNHSVSNLVIRNPEGVALMSHLGIQNELSVEEGNLYMNDFNITLDHLFTRISTHEDGKIAFNGSGRILGQAWQPLASHAPQYDHNQGPHFCLLLMPESKPDLQGTQNLLNRDQNYDSTNPSPPTPPPD